MPRRGRPEHIFQIALLDYLRVNGRPELYWFAIGNGELRHPNVALRLKAEGVTPGVPDICIMLEKGRVGWLEAKAKRGSLSDYQKGFRARALRLGHLWACVKSMQEAILILASWGVLRPGTPLMEAA
jgi:hypothetical protein